MSATILSFPCAGTPRLQRDQRLLTSLRELELRFDQVLAYLRDGDVASAKALAMLGSLEASELQGIVLGVDQ